MPEANKMEISTGIVFKTIIILLGLWFLFLVREIVLLLFISVIIVASISPSVNFLQKRKIPRSIGTLLIYLVIFSAIGIAISFLIPSLGDQLQDFSRNSARYFDVAGKSFNISEGFFQPENISAVVQQIINGFGDSLANISQNIFSKTIGVFSGLISIIVVFSLAFYMAMEENGIKKFIVSITPEKNKKYAGDLTERIENKIGKWMVGQLVLMIIVFALSFIGLYLVGVPYPLVLAILAGLLEIIPYVGPIVAAIPGVALGFLISPFTGILALLVYIIVQQLENHVIVPQIMKKAVGLNPVATIAAILIGFKLAGVLGAIIAVPAATAISLFVADMMEKN